MFEFLRKRFIPDYENTKDGEVRERYGTVIAVFSIFCNLLMTASKLLISFITNSVSIRADAFNNLSDVGSNLAALFGFRLSNKHPDADHPYGHGRMEYISGLILSFLILMMGFSSFSESVKKIFNAEDVKISLSTFAVLILSILIKLMMGSVDKKGGECIASDVLLAAAKDSFNDVIMTSATLFSLLVQYFFDFYIDAFVGTAVSLLVIKSGIETFLDVTDTILGKAPDRDFVKEIEAYVMSDPDIVGIHDLMYHDYGPSHRFITLHAEVDSRQDIITIHDKIDRIEQGIVSKFNVLATIHMDPLVLDDPDLQEYKEKILKIVKGMNERYRIHDFRMVKGPSHTNLVFDLVLPLDETDHETVRKELEEKAKELGDDIYVVANIEHSYGE